MIVRASILIACLVGFFIYPRFDAQPVTKEGFYEGPVDVLTMPQSSGGSLRAVVLGGGRRYYLRTASDWVVLGDRLQVRADVYPLLEGQDGSSGVVGELRTISAPERVSGGFFLWRVGTWVRQSFSRFTWRYGSEKAEPLLDGMCFSMTSNIPDDLRIAMAKTGTSHIVATSGLHVMLAAFAIAAGLSVFPVPRHVQLILLLILLAVYAAAAGFRPPVLRAVTMAAVFMFAYLARRSTDGLSALALAGTVNVLWAPETILNVGFQLSMVAVSSLVLFASPPEEASAGSLWQTVCGWSGRYVVASMAVTIGTAPLLAYHFGAIPIVSVAANLLVVPVLGLVIAAALASWAFALVIPPVGVGLLKIGVEPLTGWIGLVIERVGSLPFASVQIPEFSAYWLVPIYLALFAAWRPHVRTA